MTTNHEIALLNALNDVHPYGMPKKTLFADVNIRMPKNRALTLGDFDGLLQSAEAKGRIRSITGEDDVRVKITEDGQLRLSELR